MVQSWWKLIAGVGVGGAIPTWFIGENTQARVKSVPEYSLLTLGALWYFYPKIAPYGDFVGMMGATALLTAMGPVYASLRGY